MDNRREVREFLTSRRARITPERTGLPAGPRRRPAVPEARADALTTGPAFVRNGRMDLVAVNPLDRASN
ncbi:hypothetical protein GCM10009801_17560 [Streptomyces albiaxialis]|uniref:Uncharacterized protein n=1 Tax=Streptomyces albiaxialis TaxID=329523 RepID=A0ABN2VPZ7_9ACTN